MGGGGGTMNRKCILSSPTVCNVHDAFYFYFA